MKNQCVWCGGVGCRECSYGRPLLALALLFLLSGCGAGGVPGGGNTICQDQCLTPSACTITIYRASTLCPPGTLTMTEDDLKRLLYEE